MKKINEKEMMERYMSSRSGAYSWPMPSKRQTIEETPKGFAFKAILKFLCA